MSIWGRISVAATLIVCASAAHAADPRCERPPYGGSPDRYRAVLETYKQDIATVSRTLAEICKMKFDGADRAALYKLQFKDEEINRMDTEALAIETMKRTSAQPAAK